MMRKTLLFLLTAFVASIANAASVNYSTELLYNTSGDGLMVVRQIEHSDGSVTIGDYRGDMVIPELVNGVKVVAIDAGAFKDCTDLTGISIPSSVVYSGPGAFYGCTSLKKLRLEDSDQELTFIDEEDAYVTVRYWELAALEEVYVGRNYRYQHKNGEPGIPFGEPFSHHTSIKSVVFGDKVTRINEGAFGWMPNLTSVALGAGLERIEKDAFQGSEHLASRLHFPASLKYIGEFAFYGTVIPEVVIPNSVDEICDYALNISALKNVVIEDGERPIRLGAGNMDGVAPGPFGTAMFSSGGGQQLEEAYIGRPVESEWPDLFHGNATIKKVTLGKHATGLSNSYFEFCTSLETVVLSESIDHVGDLAFFGCAKLSTIDCHATTPPVCANADVFADVDKATCKLYVPAEAIDAYKTADVWKDFFSIEATSVNSISRAFQQGQIYDLQGRRLNGQPTRKGLYIVDGKKKIVR